MGECLLSIVYNVPCNDLAMNVFNENEERIREAAFEYVKSNKRRLIEEFASLDAYSPSSAPVSVFTAGAPGAGKTEFADRLINRLSTSGFIERWLGRNYSSADLVHIDPDKIRIQLPGYSGDNASIFQRAVTKGVSYIFDHCQTKDLSYVLDGTFSKYSIATENVSRAIGRNRKVILCYLYREPEVSWETVLSRSVEEGRSVPKDAFVEEYFDSIDSVNRVKEEFGKDVEVWFIRRLDGSGGVNYRIEVNVSKLDGYIPIDYSRDKLYNSLPDTLI